MSLPGESDPREGDARTDRLEGLRPQVALRGGDVPIWLIAAIMLVLALALFMVLDGKRLAREAAEQAPQQAINLPEPPPLLNLPAPPAAVVEEPLEEPSPDFGAGRIFAPLPGDRGFGQPAQMIRPAQRPPVDEVYAPPRYRTQTSPVINAGSGGGGPGGLVVDLTSGRGASINGSGAAAGAAGSAGAGGDEAADEAAVRATVLRNRASLVPQGVIIAAVLETPLNSDRPGMARALVSKDISGFDGSRVLIPRGSRLIGEFKADTSPGMRRILVNWVRLIRPDGVAIRIGSPSSDQMGGAGIPGKVNTHFFERFLGAVLQSSLMIGVNVASQIPNDGSNIYVGLPTQVGQIGQDLVPETSRPPTVKVPAGAQIAIFVARDLDFGGTPAVR